MLSLCFTPAGTYLDLKRRTLGDGGEIQLMSTKDILTNKNGELGSKKPLVPMIIPTTLDLFKLKKGSPHVENAAMVLEFLNKVRGINSDILMRYGVGMAIEKFMMGDSNVWEDQVCVTFPWMKAIESAPKLALDEEAPMEIIRIKYRSHCKTVLSHATHLNQPYMLCKMSIK